MKRAAAFVATLAVALLAAVASSSASPSPSQVRVGRAPTHPARSAVVGALADTARLPITVTLTPRDPSALAAYATAVSTPGSADYHHYLTVSQFRQRFGPTDAQIQAVGSSLTARGLAPGPVSANGLAMKLTATAGALDRAFSLSFQRVRLASGRIAFANTQAPLFPTSVAGVVQGVIGLDSLAQPHPIGLAHAPSAARSRSAIPRGRAAPAVITPGPQPCASATNAGSTYSAYTADQLASAYSFSSLYGAGDLGSGQTVALFELEPYSSSDITAYQACYSTSTSITNVPVDGFSRTGAGSGEAALDIEDVIGLAPDVSILVYEAPNNTAGDYDNYSTIISQDTAKVISTSWGICEASGGSAAAASENTLFEEAAAQGQSIFSAAGDSGSEDCGGSSLAVDDPASQPYVTGVGGTSMPAIGPPPTQSVWNDACTGGPCGGGGGISTLWGMPSYQSGAPSSLNVVNSDSSGTPCGATSGGYCREVPDVSADADPSTGYVIDYKGSWGGIGGTSASAPLWAAFMALVNASSACDGTDVGFANPVLYKAAAAGYSSDFSDITSGNNDITGTNGGKFPAGTGYDMASGLGSPVGSALPAALCKVVNTPVKVTNPGNQTDLAGAAIALAINVTDTNGAAVSFTASGLPPGVSINSSTAEISGTLTTTGAYTVTVTGTDTNQAQGSATFTWTVSARATSTSVTCDPSGVAPGHPTTCTATVTDTTSTGSPLTPAGGTVSFTAAPFGTGTFSNNGTCIAASTGTPGVGRCALQYTPGTTGAEQLTGAYDGDAAHSSSTSSPSPLTVVAAPANESRPFITGMARSGDRLSCSPGDWSGDPTSYAYQWRRDGTALAGATAASYAVHAADEGTTLTCTVTAVNAGGSGNPATSAGTRVAVPAVAGCPAAAGTASGIRLGRLALGMTPKQARAAYGGSTDQRQKYVDHFCLTPSGISAGYPSTAVLATLARAARHRMAGRVGWIWTTNGSFAIRGVRAGASLSAAEQALAGGAQLAVGASRWYVAPVGRGSAILEIRAGTIVGVGIASKQLTRTPKGLKLLLRSVS